MLIFLYGSDTYRLKQNLGMLVGEYRKKNSGLSFLAFNFDDLSAQAGEPRRKLEQFEDALKTVSFFDDKRLIRLNGARSAGDGVIALAEKYNLASDKNFIIILTENVSEIELGKKGSRKYLDFLKAKSSLTRSFESLSGKQL